jgi:hypothetical protein
MKRQIVSAVLGLAVLSTVVTSVQAIEHRLGGGVEFWTLTKNVAIHSVADSGPAWIVSYQLQALPLVSLEADVKFYDKYFGQNGGENDKEVLAPQLGLVVGKGIYGGAGVGILYSTEFADNPFYFVRAGVAFPIAPRLSIDLNLNYQFMDWDPVFQYSDGKYHAIDADVVSAAAVMRFKF